MKWNGNDNSKYDVEDDDDEEEDEEDGDDVSENNDDADTDTQTAAEASSAGVAAVTESAGGVAAADSATDPRCDNSGTDLWHFLFDVEIFLNILWYVAVFILEYIYLESLYAQLASVLVTISTIKCWTSAPVSVTACVFSTDDVIILSTLTWQSMNHCILPPPLCFAWIYLNKIKSTASSFRSLQSIMMMSQKVSLSTWITSLMLLGSVDFTLRYIMHSKKIQMS